MLESVRAYIQTHQLIQDGQSVLVGVSGGVDSMVLLHVLHELGFEVYVAHVNYQLRGDDSDADEALVRHYCQNAGVPYYSTRVDPALKEEGMSFQEAARDVRYNFFAKIAQKEGIQHIAVAHHMDDQAETLLLKLLTGSGIEGLGGMRPARFLSSRHPIPLIRPLLEQRRETILAYATARGLAWREDASNASDAYRRNVVRNEVLPLLKEHFGEAVSANMAHSASILQGYWEHSLRAELYARMKRCCPDFGRVDTKTLGEEPEVWQIRIALEVLRSWMPAQRVSRPMALALLELLMAQVGRKLVFSTGTVWRERNQLVFIGAADESLSESEIVLETLEKENAIVFYGGILDISMHVETPESLTLTDPHCILLDADTLQVPITIRSWKAGDRMKPFGMKGHKKISDLLTDAKISSSARSSACVVEAGGEVIWLIGVRMSESVKVTAETKHVCKMQFRPI